jgi:hypothetical protein
MANNPLYDADHLDILRRALTHESVDLVYLGHLLRRLIECPIPQQI